MRPAQPGFDTAAALLFRSKKRGRRAPSGLPGRTGVGMFQNGQSASKSGSITTLMKLAARAMFASSKSSAIIPGTV